MCLKIFVSSLLELTSKTDDSWGNWCKTIPFDSVNKSFIGEQTPPESRFYIVGCRPVPYLGLAWFELLGDFLASVWKFDSTRSIRPITVHHISLSDIHGSVITPPPIGERSIVMSVSVCLCLSVRDHIFGTTCRSSPIFVHVTYGHGSVLLWWRNDTLCTSGFMDDVIFALKPSLLDVSPPTEAQSTCSLGHGNKLSPVQLQANRYTGLLFGRLKQLPRWQQRWWSLRSMTALLVKHRSCWLEAKAD